MGRYWLKSLFLFFSVFLFFGSETALSHSFVIEETPIANSSLDVSPTEARVTFNSPIEIELSSLIVRNQNGIEITTEAPLFNEKQTEIFVTLPPLEGGSYTVEYYVVSSNDGHPISGDYSFHVSSGIPQEPTIPDDIEVTSKHQNETREMNSDQNENEKINSTTFNKGNLSEILISALRIIYYLGLLLLIGWVFWWHRIKSHSNDWQKKYLFWGTILQMVHLVGLLTMIALQLDIFSSNGLVISSDFFITSHFGIWWLVSLVLSLLGLLLLFRYKWFDVIWLVSIVLSKSFNGHSAEIEPWLLYVVNNSIHLLAASIWASGVWFTIVYWSKQRLQVHSFLPQFSKHALASIVILSITGILSSAGFFYYSDFALTTWTLFLWLKTFLVVFVVIIGYKIRAKLKSQKRSNLGLLLKIDFAIMITIIIVVSVLTYLNPQP